MNASVATGSVPNPTGVSPGDLIVGISQQDSNALSASRTCAISEVHALPSDPTGSPTPAIPLGSQLTLGHVTGSTYYAGNFNSLNGTSPVYTDLGPVGLGEAQSVNFKAYAVGTDPVLSVPNSLMSYDMITGASTSIADNVVNIKMVYILNPANQTGSGASAVAGTLWRPAAATGNYAPGTLSQHPLYIQQLMGIRLAVVTVNGQPDKAQVSPATLKIFPNLKDDQNVSLEVDMPLTAAQRYYRYKVTDITVPFRNMQLLNGFCA
jgi:hypothetical protein